MKFSKEWLESKPEEGCVSAGKQDLTAWIAEEKMRFIESTLPARLLAYFRNKIKKDPSLLSKVYAYCRKIARSSSP